MRAIAIALAVSLCACAADAPDGDHDEPEDFIVDPADGKADGVPASFDQNNVIDDATLTAAGSLTLEGVQAFFEDNPYGTRSWLASYEVDGVTAAEMVIEAAQTHEVNPIVLLARMQVETSLVSKTTKPTQR